MQIAKLEEVKGYYISDKGFVYRRKENKLYKLKGYYDNSNKYRVTLSSSEGAKTFTVSRLVAKYFMGATGRYVVYRIDRNDLSVAVHNLRIKRTRSKSLFVDKNRTPRKIKAIKHRDIFSYDIDYDFDSDPSFKDLFFNSITEASKFFKINASVVRNSINNGYTTDCGYIFREVV